MLDGTVIEDATLLGAGPGDGGMAFWIEGTTADGDHINEWIGQASIRTIHFND